MRERGYQRGVVQIDHVSPSMYYISIRETWRAVLFDLIVVVKLWCEEREMLGLYGVRKE